MSEAVLVAALSGPIATKADHPELPTGPEEITAAEGACEAGAAIVHRREVPVAARFGLSEAAAQRLLEHRRDLVGRIVLDPSR